MAPIPKVNRVIYTIPECSCWDRMTRVSNLPLQGWKNPFKVPTSVLDSCSKVKTSKVLVLDLAWLLVVDCLTASELAFSLNCSKNVEKLLETRWEF